MPDDILIYLILLTFVLGLLCGVAAVFLFWQRNQVRYHSLLGASYLRKYKAPDAGGKSL